MKSSRAVVVLFLALLSGVAAMVLGAKFVGNSSASTTSIVIAAQDIPMGSPITSAMLSEASWPVENKPVGATTKASDLVGRVTISGLVKGEPVLESRLAASGSKGGLTAAIPEGFRAITVRVNEIVGVAGFALPGSFIDLMVNVKRPGDEGSISKIVLEKIKILAIAQETQADASKPKVVNAVTLEVTPEQAEKIDLARSVGSLSLVLRGQSDQAIAKTQGVKEEDLLFGKEGNKPAPAPVVAPPAATKPAPKPVKVIAKAPEPKATEPAPVSRTRVEVIRGVQRSEADL
jgi:pilus assembly protein CpaB